MTIDFTKNLSCRKIVKFSHCGIYTIAEEFCAIVHHFASTWDFNGWSLEEHTFHSLKPIFQLNYIFCHKFTHLPSLLDPKAAFLKCWSEFLCGNRVNKVLEVNTCCLLLNYLMKTLVYCNYLVLRRELI